MMLRIAVEVTGTVCGVGCSIFSQTVDRLLPLTAYRSLASQVGSAAAASLAATESCVYALSVRRQPVPRG